MIGSMSHRLQVARKAIALARNNGLTAATKRSTGGSRRPLSSSVQPIVELREYNLIAQHQQRFLHLTKASHTLQRSLLPLRMFSMPDTGGNLGVATHLYYYEGGYAERDAKRAAAAQNRPWQVYLRAIYPAIEQHSSLIFVEAPILKDHGLVGLAGNNKDNVSSTTTSDNTIYELRRYKLRLGYDTVPNFLQLYGAGLPSKLNAPGNDPSTSLVTLLYNEVGRLNEVIEIWRHGEGTAAMERSRVAARSATEWRNSIKDIAGLALEFTNTIHRPTDFSPMR